MIIFFSVLGFVCFFAVLDVCHRAHQFSQRTLYDICGVVGFNENWGKSLASTFHKFNIPPSFALTMDAIHVLCKTAFFLKNTRFVSEALNSDVPVH